MAGPTAGDYRIVCAANPALSLDVSGGVGGGGRDGQNVQVWTANGSDAQVFNVSYRSDGTAQVLSRWCAKSVDVDGGNLVAGTNVQIWTDNDTRAQQWDITDLGENMTVDGTALPLYKVCLTDAPTLCMQAASAASGSNVTLGAYTSAAGKKWAFVPIEPFRSGGVYEIRSMVNTSFCADVASASKANGANVQLYACNHTNAQKWLFTNEGADGWSVRNIASGKYMDVSGATFADGTNVQSYEDNDTRAQRWSVETLGTEVVEGETCQVATIGAGNGAAYVLDVLGADSSNGSNLQIYQANGTYAQRWALWPTWAEDEFMPSPHSLVAAAEVGKTKLGGNTAAWGNQMEFRFYPSWACAPAYATSGPNGYQIRHRTRFMSASTSTWRAWSDWSAWETAAVTRSGQRSWLTEGIAVVMNKANKLAQAEFEVRATGAEGQGLLYGAPASKSVTCYPIPNTSMTAAGWSPEGVRLAVTSDYVGETVITVTSAKVGAEEILTAPATFGKLDDMATVLVERALLSTFPDDGAALKVSYKVGTDMADSLSETMTATVQLSYDAGSIDGTPTVAEGPNRSILATVPHVGTERMWVSFCGSTIECKAKSVGQGLTTFEVPYPFGVEYTLFASGESEDSDDWFTWHGTRTGEDGPVHAWTWDGGYAEAEYIGDGDPRSDETVKAVYESNVLDSRPYEKVEFAATRKSSLDATGRLGPVTASNPSDFHELAGKHALYRSKAGDYCDVAVTDVKLRVMAYWTNVDVSMIREA